MTETEDFQDQTLKNPLGSLFIWLCVVGGALCPAAFFCFVDTRYHPYPLVACGSIAATSLVLAIVFRKPARVSRRAHIIGMLTLGSLLLCVAAAILYGAVLSLLDVDIGNVLYFGLGACVIGAWGLWSLRLGWKAMKLVQQAPPAYRAPRSG